MHHTDSLNTRGIKTILEQNWGFLASETNTLALSDADSDIVVCIVRKKII